MFTFTGSKEKYIQYYLIHSKEDNKENEFKLTNKNISIKRGDLSAKIWLNFLSIKKYHQSYITQIKEEVVLEKQSSGILKVYFKEVDYSVVSKSTWEIMSELNPSIMDKIIVVKKSPVIFTSYIGILSNRLSKDIANKFINSAKKVNTTTRGKQILYFYRGVIFREIRVLFR